MTTVYRVSIIVPMLDEAEHVDRLVSDIARQDFSGELEVLVADGGSTDGSIDRIMAAAERAALALTVIPNPKRWVSAGLNSCIRQANGQLIVRMDCHAQYPRDYVRLCVKAAQETGAWNVGNVWIPRGRTTMEKAVACAMTSPFGGVGWTRHSGSAQRVEVDTVVFGAFDPVAFRTVGLFDETLVRNQDDELNLRLRRAGGRIVLDPSIRVHYTPRGSLSAVFRQYYEYGYWKVALMKKHGRIATLRSLAPLGLVTSLSLVGAGAVRSPLARRLLSCELLVYGGALLAFATASAARSQNLRLIPRVVTVFPVFHFGYGIGMLVGLLDEARRIARATGPRTGIRLGPRPNPRQRETQPEREEQESILVDVEREQRLA